MPYSAHILRQAHNRLEQEKADNQSRYNQRIFEAYEKVPRLREISGLMRRNMARAATAALGGDAVAAMDQARQENQKLQQE